MMGPFSSQSQSMGSTAKRFNTIAHQGPMAARVRAKLGLEGLRFSPATSHFVAKDS